MKKILIIASIALLGLVGCKPSSSSSSEHSESSSQPIINVNPKEEILDICDEIIANSENKELISSTYKVNGNVSLTNLDSVTSIYYSNKLTFTDFVLNSSSEFIESSNTSKSLLNIDGKVDIDHNEEYLGTEEGINVENFNKSYILDESIMSINDAFYFDLSSACNELFTDEQLELCPDLKFKQEDFSVIIDELMSEYDIEIDTSSIDINEINTNELLDKIVGDDSLFNEYLKYLYEDEIYKLKLSLKPADFNELLNDLVLEYDPESTIPVSTIINMESNNSSKIEIVFNFENRDISSMDFSINGRFSLLGDSYTMNANLQGSIINNEITSFVGLEGYENYLSCEAVNTNVKDEIKELLDKIIPIIEEESTPNE